MLRATNRFHLGDEQFFVLLADSGLPYVKVSKASLWDTPAKESWPYILRLG